MQQLKLMKLVLLACTTTESEWSIDKNRSTMQKSSIVRTLWSSLWSSKTKRNDKKNSFRKRIIVRVGRRKKKKTNPIFAFSTFEKLIRSIHRLFQFFSRNRNHRRWTDIATCIFWKNELTNKNKYDL